MEMNLSTQMDGKPSRIVGMVFSRWTARIARVLVGPVLLLGAARLLGQQNNQNAPSNAPTANGQSRTSQQSSSQAQGSGNKGATPAPSQNGQSTSNPFPMAQSEAAAKANAQKNTQPTQSDSSPAPSSPGSGTSRAASGGGKSSQKHDNSAAQSNPFPEAQSAAAAKGDQGGAGGSGNSQAGSSSSPGGYSSSDAHLPAPDVGQGNLGTHEKLDSFTRDQTRDGRIQDDLSVADLYMKNGNYRGGYMRYEDALQYDPQNDTALYGIAEALCKENVTSEAMARFKSYATNNPQGKYARDAEKMLAHPEKCEHNR